MGRRRLHLVAFFADLVILLLHGLICFVLFHLAARGQAGPEDRILLLAISTVEVLIFGPYLLLPAWFVTIQFELDENTLIYRSQRYTTRFPLADITAIPTVDNGIIPNLQIISNWR